MNGAIVTTMVVLSVLSWGGFQVYDYVTMTEAEKFLLANIEALTEEEGTAASYCYAQDDFGPMEERVWFLPCDPRTSGSKIYPCPEKEVWSRQKGARDRCTK